MSAAWWAQYPRREVQQLVLTGYPFDHARHFVLKVRDAALARSFLRKVLGAQLLIFGDPSRPSAAVNIGFTYNGLSAFGVRSDYLGGFANKSPAYAAGAPARAAAFLGDTGTSAVERWDRAFALDHADVWIALHGEDESTLDALTARLRHCLPGEAAFTGWDDAMPARTLPPPTPLAAANPPVRYVHFGFRDNISQPVIQGGMKKDHHRAGELLLGYRNDKKFNFWTGDGTPADLARFARNGSFGILRKIEQDEPGLRDYLEREATRLLAEHPFVTPEYLQAKMCGRWPDGSLVTVGATVSPHLHPNDVAVSRFDSEHDKEGLGCPFGAHIRRTNPRTDPIAPPKHLRTLFRRGMPYGPLYEASEDPDIRRGLMGGFFCASIEDQFERLLSEWVEKNPMGPPNHGRAKDPLVGHHENPDDELVIPQPKGRAKMGLKNFQPFVQTRGTLYAFFPSRATLKALADGRYLTARPRPAKPPAPAPGPAPLPSPPPPPNLNAVEPGAAPRDRFCDIVMEGGVTSGIIYATAVARLARHYRFRNIGGSSIGAFAAALTAAAEYRRRRGSFAGFETVASMPTQLAAIDKLNGLTMLRNLFAPQNTTKRLFAIFVAMLNRNGSRSRASAGIVAAVQQYGTLCGALGAGVFAAVCLLAAISLYSLPPTFAAVAPWLIVAALTVVPAILVGLVIGLLWDVVRGLVPNGFGLCRGNGGLVPDDSYDLATYLYGAIQKAAGLNEKDGLPLTFGDLWEAPGAPAEVLGYAASGPEAWSINLEVYSSNLAHGRPYRFPLDPEDDMGRLFFTEREFRDYFPGALVDYLVGVSVPYRPLGPADPPASTATRDFLELPTHDLPIAVAARLAMSFPLLISAVPLWAVDREARSLADRKLEKCWMSDGGLCSNFPIHLFDSWIPRWPTFGISLQSRSTYRPNEAVWLPEYQEDGRGDKWDHAPVDTRSALGRLGAFVASIWLTAWGWNDSTMMRMPGVRDRVVRVFLEPGEGGVNICMTSDQIMQLSTTYGDPAAQAFITKFADPDSRGWAEHRWVRFNTLLVAVRERIQGLKGAADTARHTVPLPAQIRDGLQDAPLRCAPGDRPGPSGNALTPEQVGDLFGLLRALESLEKSFDAAGPIPFEPVPLPSLRIRHPT